MNDWQQQLQQAAALLAENDPILAAVIQKNPLPTITPHTQYYQELVESIISQQLSVKAAATISQRFKQLFGDIFPTPQQILEKDSETLRSAGLSMQKASYIRDLASKVEDGTVRFEHLDELTNQEIIDELMQIKGVGIWTVHMFLIFCMGRLNVLPVGDLGIKNGMQRLYNLPDKPDASVMEAIAHKNNWHPYESVASWYVWRSLNNTPALEHITD